MNPEHIRTFAAGLRRCSRAFAVYALILAPALAQALPDDRNQPIHIQADRAQLDQRQGVTIYEGDVQLTQGSLQIVAERITIHTNADNRVQKLVAKGRPARLQQQPDPEKSVIIASAESIDYDVNSEQVLLLSNARLEQGGATMTGNRIDYDILQDIVNVAGEAGTEQPRVQMVIPPQNRDNSED
jgi:lipopolysaccharide export system protein LptA